MKNEISNIIHQPLLQQCNVSGRRRIAVSALDGKIPNLAIMKICGYHEAQGDEVVWYDGALFANTYDKIYMSKIFGFTPMPEFMPENAVIGGTGIDYHNRLPAEIEAATPSYTLYPKCNYHLGFSMKGCRFACKFCCVPKKEGRPYNYNDIDEILINPNGGNRLMLLDNDFFGGDWETNLNRIIELKLRVCFVQGLNIRIITDEQAALLAKCNYQNSKFNKKYLTFAWDKYKDGTIVKKGIDICVKAGIPTTNMQFFVLIGFDTTPEQDMERVMTLHDMGAKPFVMAYNREDKYQKAFQRWVNYRPAFNSCTWSDYEYNPERRRSVACH